MKIYRTFLRSANSFEEFAKAEKIEQETGLTREEAKENCKNFNTHRNDEEIAAGTKMEFEEE